MKKALLMGLACLALLALVAAPTFACGNDSKSASTTTATDGKLVSADGKASCEGMKDAKATSADAKACCAGHGTSATAASADGKQCPATGCEMVNMSIKGMTCGGCESTVRASLEKIPGVVKVVTVSYKDGSALVCMDPKKCKAESLTSAVADKGYEAQVVPAVATSTTDAKADCAAKCTGSATDKAACAAKCAKGEKAKTPEDSK
jgi:copper chaperone CopZ